MVDLSSSQTVTSSLPEANNQSNFLQWHAVPCVQGRKNPRIVGTVPLSFWSLEYIWPICPNNLLTIEPIYTCIYIYYKWIITVTHYIKTIYIYINTCIRKYAYIHIYINTSLSLLFKHIWNHPPELRPRPPNKEHRLPCDVGQEPLRDLKVRVLRPSQFAVGKPWVSKRRRG